jgi:hypothetical protein
MGNSGGRLAGKFLTFTEKLAERPGKFAAGTFRRMQDHSACNHFNIR